MKKFYLFTFSVFMIFSSSLFAMNRILENPQQTYDSLGELELRVSNQHHTVKFLTLGFVKNRSYKSMTRELSKKLLSKARNKYGADAIANVAYWPGDNSGEAVDYLYGRAEMLRFKKFPNTDSSPELNEPEVQTAL